MAVNDIVGVRIVGRFQDQNIVNTMHYRIDAQGTDENTILQILTDQWEASLKTAWLARHLDAYSLVGLKGFSLTGDNKVPGITHILDPGVVTGTETPSPVCRTITLYTDSSNYRRRGRVMLSGSETLQFNIDDGGVTDAEMVLLNVLGTALIGDLTFVDNTFKPGLAPTATLPFEPFTAALARKTPSLIRSRRVRGFSIG